MSFEPTLISFDVETCLTNGEASVEFWRDDFRVSSAAFAWRREDGSIRTLFVEGEDDIAAYLRSMEGIPMVVHNYAFEKGVCDYRFSGINIDLKYDTMRLAQVADGGGNEADKFKVATKMDDMLAELEGTRKNTYGLGLEKCASRWLGSELHNHKKEAYDWLHENGVRKGQEGKNLTELPTDILQRYNEADVIVTLRLYEELTEYLKSVKYSWEFDHELYIKLTNHVVTSQGRGTPVDILKLRRRVELADRELEEMERAFRELYPKEIQEIEQELFGLLTHRKTERGANAAKERVLANGDHKFNIGSKKQLEMLFVHKLGMTTNFYTPKGRPSFKKTHLHVWGKGGELLVNRGTIMLSRTQAKSLIEMAEYDGRVHLQLRTASTATGRNAGGAGKE